MEATRVKVSASMLDRARKAEEVLAREKAKELEDALPAGHPLRVEVERQKAILGGDLSGLPVGHPLLKALEAAQKRHEEKAADVGAAGPEVVAGCVAGRPDEPRRAKKLDRDAVRRDSWRQEEEASERRRAAASEVNGRIQAVMDASRELLGSVDRHAEILNTDPFSRARADRLRRMLVAVDRGMADCRMVRV